MKWTPATVGCYWHSGDFTIGTRVAYRGGTPLYTYPESGYVLRCNRKELGIYETLDDAQHAAESMGVAVKV